MQKINTIERIPLNLKQKALNQVFVIILITLVTGDITVVN